ncbi:FecCD family ABC transporter permease [Arthrobacter sp. UM1]|uniref:FecCD family ABC transporter permease n=1 Tax=Arthrobacter sp. UM1 TaxID=2766776 RepID=UPI001CF669EC|nr:iron chelate uptake ABC transporter family permease subunit [Arthrobacter sp. UM1]MCB4208511.1 iron ABC transporter permease [Arthrobacter sp. UM1]
MRRSTAQSGTTQSGTAQRGRVLAVLAAAVGLLFFGSILLGDYTVTIPDFFRILGGEEIPGATFIVMESKLPQAVAGALAGFAFGLSGSLFQRLLRNPLASPDIIGVNYGASAAAVTSIVAFGLSGAGVGAAAVLGALGTAAVLYAVSMRGRSTVHASGRLILTGIGMAAMMSALVNWLLARGNIYKAQEAMVWLNGSLNAATWDRIGALALALAVLVPAVALIVLRLRMLELGDDLAQGLGVSVTAARLAVVVAAVLLSAMATSVTGPLAFVAFLAGPLSRLLTGRRLSLAAAALTGAALVLAAQFVSVVLLPQLSLPVGIITGAVGAPVLIAVLVGGRRQARAVKGAS